MILLSQIILASQENNLISTMYLAPSLILAYKLLKIILVVVGKGSLTHTVFPPPTWLLKDGPWVCDTSLPRDKELTQPVLGLSSCVGIFSTVSSSVSILLFYLSG